MSEASEITTEIETGNALETLLLVQGLIEAKESEEKHGCESGVRAIEGLLEQMEKTTAYAVMMEDDEQ